jgi:hypothetical protein
MLLKPMGQSRRGVAQVLEAQVRPLIVAILRFIQLMVPLLLLKLMGQSIGFKGGKGILS